MSPAKPNPGQPPPLFLGSPVAVLVGVGGPSSSSPSPLRARELASFPGPPGALNSPLLGAEPKRWKKDVYKLLKGKRKKVGGGAERPRLPGSVDWGLSGEGVMPPSPGIMTWG